nr:hypothetical protein PanWU01x14_057330 [Ipomoea trifida]
MHSLPGLCIDWIDEAENKGEKKESINGFHIISTKALTSSVLLVIVGGVLFKGGNGVGAGEPRRSREANFPGVGIGDRNMGERDPEEQLLTLDPSKMLKPAVLHKRGDLGVVPHKFPDLLKLVLLRLLLLHPHEPRFPVPPHLHVLVQREQPSRHVDLL